MTAPQAPRAPPRETLWTQRAHLSIFKHSTTPEAEHGQPGCATHHPPGLWRHAAFARRLVRRSWRDHAAAVAASARARRRDGTAEGANRSACARTSQTV